MNSAPAPAHASQAGRIPVLAWLFVLLVLPASLFGAIAVPLDEVPDEHTHIVRAAALLGGQIMGYRHEATGPDGGMVAGAGFDVDPVLPLIAREMAHVAAGDGGRVDAARLASLRALPWTGAASFVEASNMAIYPPVSYVPAALGLGLARAAGLGPFDALLAGRVANALTYVALGVLTLTRAARGRLLLFCVLVLPMSLWLAPTFNQDGLLIAGAALAGALLTGCQARGSVRGPGYWIAAGLLGCVILAKPPTLPMAALLLLPAAADPPGRWRRGVALTLAAGPMLIWTLAALHHAAVPLARLPYLPGPLYQGPPGTMLREVGPALQLPIFSAHPALLVLLPLRTLAVEYQEKLMVMVGVLGPLTIFLPDWLYTAWGVALGCAIAAAVVERGGGTWHPGFGLLALAALGAAMLLLYDTLYLTWTEIGKTRVDGIQGRYFLPLFPLLLMALPRLPLSAFAALPVMRVCGALPVALAVYDAVMLPQLVLRTYYLR